MVLSELINVVTPDGFTVLDTTAGDASSAAAATSSVPAQPGDCIEPNNLIPLDEANSFMCTSRLTIGVSGYDDYPRQIPIIPQKVPTHPTFLSHSASLQCCLSNLSKTV